MTPEELHRIVRILANSCYVRYWLHYNYPETPAYMAISVYGHGSISTLHKELKERGFTPLDDTDLYTWKVLRTD